MNLHVNFQDETYVKSELITLPDYCLVVPSNQTIDDIVRNFETWGEFRNVNESEIISVQISDFSIEIPQSAIELLRENRYVFVNFLMDSFNKRIARKLFPIGGLTPEAIKTIAKWFEEFCEFEFESNILFVVYHRDLSIYYTQNGDAQKVEFLIKN